MTNRQTYCDWNKTIMGPILDEHGLEQGGVNSSDCYKIYNNDLLDTVQQSEQGVDFGDGLVVSGVGQADDVGLLSNDIFSLVNILSLVINYCNNYCVDLCADKTKLLVMAKNEDQKFIPYNPVSINGSPVTLNSEAEHVGVLRSTEGNLPHVMKRILSHKKALRATLSSGLARSHRGNVAASIRIQNLYGTPVLFSGLSSLVLSKAEINLVEQHFKSIIQNLLKLHPGTPQSFLMFMSGSLPATAILHLKQLSLFSMISRLPGDPLNILARKVLSTSKPSSKSWFWQVRDICLLYLLPHPLQFLDEPLPKIRFKKLAKSHIIDYWEKKLRSEASLLPSLAFFRPEFHSLSKPHPIVWTPGSNPYEVSKSIVQCKMLSGRYRTEMLTSHWSNNKEGYCLAPTCLETEENLEHILLDCPFYSPTRLKLLKMWNNTENVVVKDLAFSALHNSPLYLMQFILDASVLPKVILAVQQHGKDVLYSLFHLTRTWCFSIHRERSKFQGKWNFR